jgi:hypothetical protein
MHEPSFGGTDGEPVSPLGDHPPYPPLSDFAGRMATSRFVLVLPTQAEVAR